MLTYFQNLSFGKKLQVINLSIVGLITFLIAANLGYYMFGALLTEYKEKAHTLADVLNENLDSPLMFQDAKAAQDVLHSLHAVPNILHATVYDKSGHLLASYAATNYSTKKIPQKFDPSLFEQIPRLGQPLLGIHMPILGSALNDEQIGTITLLMDLSDAYSRLYRQIGILLLGGIFVLLVVSTLLTRLQEVITQPLIKLTKVMRTVSQEGDLSVRADITGQDEIGEIAVVFNEMVEKLSRRENSLQVELNERRHIEEKLSEIAHVDPVTNLPNRHSFDNQIARVLLNFKYDLEKFALMYIDLDNFKYVNDTFGHHLGDLLLSRIAERMRKSLRQGDFVARLGGDEFAIIMSDFSDNSQIGEVAEKILASMKSPFSLEGREVFIGASIGISICPVNGTNSEILKRQADSAMYLAKNLGKNNYQFYQDELSRTQQNRINIESSLRRSLERNEIAVYYQPIVEISEGKIVGFEALARWIREDGTVVRPDGFIPLAEEIGLIIDIGNFILNAAAAQTADWVERYGLAFTSVNFSSRQFKQNDLASEIIEALRNVNLNPKNFEMEITESILMDRSIDSLDMLNLLIGQGMGISIDDFGTGYSSLSYITSFPISKIKIDQSFTTKLPGNKNALAVVTAIIGLAKSLNLKVVAEGIETPEQLECLKKLGCQYGQGFLFSKPVPATEATGLLDSRKARTA